MLNKKEKITFCDICMDDIPYRIIDCEMTGRLGGKTHTYHGQKAFCTKCSNEVYVGKIADANMYALYKVYKKRKNGKKQIMPNKKEIIYMELNNWMPEDNYPPVEPFLSWLGNYSKLKFLDKEYIKSNKLCVSVNMLDISICFRITAPKEWAEDNCPELLTKYCQFIVKKGKDNKTYDRFGYPFLEYKQSNIGIHWCK